MLGEVLTHFHGDDFGAIGYRSDVVEYGKMLTTKYRGQVKYLPGTDSDLDKERAQKMEDRDWQVYNATFAADLNDDLAQSATSAPVVPVPSADSSLV